MSDPSEPTTCPRCRPQPPDWLPVTFTAPYQIERIVTTLGHETFNYLCPNCKTSVGGLKANYARELVDTGLATVRVDRDNTSLYRPGPVCEYLGCLETRTQRHHWAPVNTFGWDAAEQWPTAHLCQSHHSKWHTTMDGYRRCGRGV